LAAVLGVLLFFISVVAAYNNLHPGGRDRIEMSMSIMSPAFKYGTEIPGRHTCDGPNISPQLKWDGVPAGTQSLVLIVDDPDAPDPSAPEMIWVHWLLYNIPAHENSLAEGVTEKNIPAGTLPGINDWNRALYGGPCPPIGMHRYFFKLYALDHILPDLKKPNRTKLEQAMQGHVLDQASLMGVYRRHP